MAADLETLRVDLAASLRWAARYGLHEGVDNHFSVAVPDADGVVLGKGGHQAHLKLFGYAVEPMAKTTFYFSVAVLVAVDIIQSGYQKKLAVERTLAAA